MGGREELLARVRVRVTRCSWEDFLRLAEAYGFSLKVGKGSRRRLVHPTGLVVSVHEPHPRSCSSRSGKGLVESHREA
ncbi:type II toxin-antitoxin system HicA family toxin [Thermus islandicus]|uniref:type II toxin-antitoxin system HicA family toxin n=1 Tax=Thermus islandicus TaxID=540988 RepID=UPI0012EB2C11